MVRDIKILGSKVLRGISEKVEEVGDEELELIQDMIDTMRVNNGVGLAAPQIGVLKRIVVVEFEDRLFTMINPEILEYFGDKLADKEGCLSVPTIFENVSRDEGVVVSWVDRDGKEHVIKARGFLA
ncbi:MAG: peptide deformylase, partial [Synergistetes bacterium]|nr:peptide deformylase [Synergistota bacterium]